MLDINKVINNTNHFIPQMNTFVKISEFVQSRTISGVSIDTNTLNTYLKSVTLPGMQSSTESIEITPSLTISTPSNTVQSSGQSISLSFYFNPLIYKYFYLQIMNEMFTPHGYIPLQNPILFGFKFDIISPYTQTTQLTIVAEMCFISKLGSIGQLSKFTETLPQFDIEFVQNFVYYEK